MSLKNCPHCGFSFDKDFTFCPECGKRVSGEQVNKTKKTVKNQPEAGLFDFDAEASVNTKSSKTKRCTKTEALFDLDVLGELSDSTVQGTNDPVGLADGFDRQLSKNNLLKKAHALCVRELFDEALKIYEQYIDDYYDEVEGYIGLLRVHSKDYSVYEGTQIEKDIKIIERIAGGKQITDSEYLDYLKARDKHFAKIEAARIAAEKRKAAALAKAEAKRKAEEEAKRKAEEERLALEKAQREAEEAERLAKERARKEAQAKAEEEARKKAEFEAVWQINKGVLVKYKGRGGDVKLPDIVTAIGDKAFLDCKDLTSITITDKVKNIGSYAFSGCELLTSVVIPSGVISIAEYAFYKCKALKKVVLPKKLYIIKKFAFAGCSSLEKIEIPDNVSSIGVSAFSGCSSLTDIDIPSSVKQIHSDAFSKCSALLRVHVPSTTEVHKSAFTGTKYQSNLDSCVISLGVLKKFTALSREVEIPNGITDIGEGAFKGCTSLEKVIFPRLRNIESDAFKNCTMLKTLVFNGSVSRICDCFSGSIKHKDVYIYSLSKWCNIDFSRPINGGYDLFLNGEQVTGLIIPDDVVAVNPNVFSGCSSIKCVTMPNCVTRIGYSAFENCKSLTHVVLSENLTTISKKTFSGCTALSDVVLPDRLKTIEDNSFCGTAVTEIVIPDSVTDVGKNAFSDCKALTKLVLNNNLKTIGENAFHGSAITDIVIPDSVTDIGTGAFSDCKALTRVVLSKGMTAIDNNVFNGCSSLTDISIPNTIHHIDSNAFIGCNKLKYNVYDNALYLGNKDNKYLFLIGAKNNDITSCIIHKETRFIRDLAFSNCKKLKSIIIEGNVKKIGSYAFYCCEELTEITISPTVREIGKGAFYYCKSLKKVIMNKNFKNQREDLFPNELLKLFSKCKFIYI